MTATSEPRIPLNDLLRNTQGIRDELDAAISRALDSGYYVLGPENAALEAELSAYVGLPHTVLLGNGTDALQLALAAVGVGRGDRVATVANAGGYTSTAVRALGATPLYVDIEPDGHLISARTFEEALASTPTLPKALVITHLYGSPVDIAPLVDGARRHGIAVVEDCAQALGARRDGAMTGTFGDVATTSFYPTKNLGAIGDAGALFTAHEEIADVVRRLRQYGWESKYRAVTPGGMNSRLDELQAAILRVKLPHLDRWNERRRAVHATYEQAASAGLRFVSTSAEGSIGHLAVIETDHRDETRRRLDGAGIATDVHYPVPDHLQPLASGEPRSSLPVTERMAGRILSIPLFPELRDDEIARVCDALAGL